MLNPEHLLTFARVARLGSLSAAAEELYLTQPAVSHQLKLLTHAVGEPLFRRHRTGVHLTAAGEGLLPHAQALARALEGAQHYVQELRGLERGVLSVAASSTIAAALLPRVLTAFHSQYPEVTFQVRQGNTREVLDALQSGQVELALIEGPPGPLGPHLQARAFGEDELILVDGIDKLDIEFELAWRPRALDIENDSQYGAGSFGPLAAQQSQRGEGEHMSHIQRETSCSKPRLNSNMDADLYGYKWARDNVGQSGATIYRLYGKPDAPELFLKHGKGSVANDVTDEMVRLNWLTEFMPLPTIKHFIRTPDDAWLLTTAIPGKTAFQVLEEYPDSGENIVDALAVFLRRLHSIPVCNCPFNSDHVFRLAQAQSRMNNGLVDASDFDDERNGWPVEQVWKEMHKLLPFSPDSVVTHGDFSLDNLIFDEGKLIGCIDVGRVGIADRYQDLAILWNCLGEFSPSLQKRLFQKYGIDNPDMNKLQFHLMLDEFF